MTALEGQTQNSCIATLLKKKNQQKNPVISEHNPWETDFAHTWCFQQTAESLIVILLPLFMPSASVSMAGHHQLAVGGKSSLTK